MDLASATSRPGGPFGSAAYLGAACALLVPLCAGAAVDGLDTTRRRNAAWIAGGLGVFAALAAQTRAGWVGLIAAALISLPALSSWLRRRWPVAAAAAVGLVMVAVISPIGDRALGAFDFSDGTARGRIDEWQVGARVAVNHPVLGVGMEGYRIAFAEGVDADYERRYTRATMPDRAHSGPLDVAVAGGLPGMALYLAAIAFLVRRAFLAVRSRQPWLAGIGAGVAGYIAQQLFLFPITEVDPVFWLLAGALVAATGRDPSGVLHPRAWVAAVVWALAAGAAVVGVLDVAADRKTFDAATNTFFAEQALADADAAVALRPDSIRYRAIAANVAARPVGGAGLPAAIDRIEGALQISPRDPILRETEASLRLRLARETQDGAELRIAISLFEGLVAYDPVHARYRFELGGAYAILGNDAGAIEQLRTAADLAPRATAPLVRLVEVFAGTGMTEEGLAVIAELAARGLGEPELQQLRSLLTG